MRTSCFTNALCDELIAEVVSHLDPFGRVRFALTTKDHAARFMAQEDREHVERFYQFRNEHMNECLRMIRRINTDGVVLGECLDCGREALLYTRFDGLEERTVCLDRCMCNNYHYHDRPTVYCRSNMLCR